MYSKMKNPGRDPGRSERITFLSLSFFFIQEVFLVSFQTVKLPE